VNEVNEGRLLQQAAAEAAGLGQIRGRFTERYLNGSQGLRRHCPEYLQHAGFEGVAPNRGVHARPVQGGARHPKRSGSPD
jgi:hypothetical protein